MAEREVVLHRIDRIQLSQRVGNLPGHRPARAGVAGQPQAAAQADDMRVEWDDQSGARYCRPYAQIERVAANHPTQEEIEPFAGTASRWPREEITDARRSLRAARSLP